MKQSNGKFLNLLSFVALVIAALLIFVCKLLTIVGLEITGSLINILETVRDCIILLVISLSAFNFVSGKGKATKIIFAIAICRFIAGILLIWFAK